MERQDFRIFKQRMIAISTTRTHNSSNYSFWNFEYKFTMRRIPPKIMP